MITGFGVGYKLIFRTKLRDPRTVDLQTGRRYLNVDEIKMLDDHYRLPKWRRVMTFLQLW